VLGNGINIWNIGINLLQPLFRGGELQARKRAAEAGYEQALAPTGRPSSRDCKTWPTSCAPWRRTPTL
jgi:hypothetical protein